MYRMKGIIEALSRNRFCRGKAVTIKYSECVFITLSIQHSMRTHVILSFVVSSTVPHFFTLSHKLREFQGGGIFLNINCVLIFSTIFV